MYVHTYLLIYLRIYLLTNAHSLTHARTYAHIQLKLDSWTKCAITQMALESPMAVCQAGALYTYQSALNYLMEKKTFHYFRHIKYKELIKIKPEHCGVVDTKNGKKLCLVRACAYACACAYICICVCILLWVWVRLWIHEHIHTCT